jgi:hypothetical protein
MGRRRRGSLPQPRPLVGPLRDVDSAETRLRRLVDGRLLLTIRHEPLRGVTPEMLSWWFAHIPGEMVVDGRAYPRYLVWHPYDHIRHEVVRRGRDGTVGAGSRFRIVEALGRDPGKLIDSVEGVDLLDATGIRLSRRLAGVEVFSLHHRFCQVPGGTQYDSTMIVGAAGALGRRVVNPVLQPRIFDEAMGHAWLRHNVEEVGLFEHFLPSLYAARA